MKILKKMFKIFLGILLVPVLFLGCTSVYQFIMSFSDTKRLPAYGKKIATDNGKMNIVENRGKYE